MGVRKRNSAEKIKEAKKVVYGAKLRNVPSSPRKMRYVADMVRGMEVFKALGCQSGEIAPLGNRQLGTKERT